MSHSNCSVLKKSNQSYGIEVTLFSFWQDGVYVFSQLMNHFHVSVLQEIKETIFGKSCASHRWKIKLKKSVRDVISLRLTRFTGTTNELTESHLHIAQNWTASTIYYDLMNDIIRPFQSWLWVNIWASRLEGNQKLFTRTEYSVSVSSTQVRRQIEYN